MALETWNIYQDEGIKKYYIYFIIFIPRNVHYRFFLKKAKLVLSVVSMRKEAPW